jgi:iSTAND domain-containing protein
MSSTKARARSQAGAGKTSNTRLEDNANLEGVGSIGENYGTIIVNRGPPNETQSQQPLAHSVALKYRADRDEQERLIRQHLTNHRASRRPIVFFIHGEESQHVDGFVQRLGLEMIRRHLRAINGTDQVEWKNVSWPRGGGRTAEDAERIAVYKDSLTGELEIMNGSAAAIAERIALYRRPVVLSSVHRQVVDEDDEPTVRAVLDMWASLPDLRTELSLIIIVAMIYADLGRGFMSRFLSRPKTSTLALKLAKFDGYRPNQLKAVVLPELSDVSLEEVEHWVRNVLRPPDIEDALRRVREVFGAKRAPLPMVALEKHLEALAPTDRPRLRLQ